MGPYEYEVASIDGDYAVLRRTDNDTHDEILVARAFTGGDRHRHRAALRNVHLFHRLTFNYWQK